MSSFATPLCDDWFNDLSFSAFEPQEQLFLTPIASNDLTTHPCNNELLSARNSSGFTEAPPCHAVTYNNNPYYNNNNNHDYGWKKDEAMALLQGGGLDTTQQTFHQPTFNHNNYPITSASANNEGWSKLLNDEGIFEKENPSYHHAQAIEDEMPYAHDEDYETIAFQPCDESQIPASLYASFASTSSYLDGICPTTTTTTTQSFPPFYPPQSELEQHDEPQQMINPTLPSKNLPVDTPALNNLPQTKPNLINPDWIGKNYSFDKLTILSDKRDATYQIRLDPIDPEIKPRVATRNVIINVTAHMFPDKEDDEAPSVSIGEVTAIQYINGTPPSMMQIQNNDKAKQPRKTPQPRRARRSKASKDDEAKPAPKIKRQRKKKKKGGIPELVVENDTASVIIHPLSHRLVVHKYSFNVTVEIRGMDEKLIRKSETIVESNYTGTYSHITQHVHKLFQKMIRYQFDANTVVSAKQLERLIRFLDELNHIEGFNAAAFKEFPCPDIGRDQWFGRNLTEVVDWFINSCETLQRFKPLYDAGYLHGALSLTTAVQRLKGQPLGSFLLRLGYKGLILSYISSETQSVEHTLVDPACPQYLLALLSYPQTSNAVVDTTRLRLSSPSLHKVHLQGLLAGMAPVPTGFSVPFQVPLVVHAASAASVTASPSSSLNPEMACAAGSKRKLTTSRATDEAVPPTSSAQGKGLRGGPATKRARGEV